MYDLMVLLQQYRYRHCTGSSFSHLGTGTWYDDGVWLFSVLAEAAHTVEGLQESLQVREQPLLQIIRL